VLQVRVPFTLAVAPGTVLFCVTATIAIDLQPLAGIVTVTVSIPTALTVGFCNVDFNPFDPDQLYITPAVPELPERVTEDVVQLRVPLTFAVAPGVVIFWTTFTEADAEHPVPLETVKV
jgi:hypothetical protein